jgi:hypothetical protein
MLSISLAVPLTAVAVVSGCGMAGAASVGLAAGRAGGHVADAASRSDCSEKQHPKWNVTGRNKIITDYAGFVYKYTIRFEQKGSCLSGRLTDPYYPVTGKITGTVKGDHIKFTFHYPRGSVQGVRTYTGIIHRSGAVSGKWKQTGSEVPNHSRWKLAHKVAKA